MCDTAQQQPGEGRMSAITCAGGDRWSFQRQFLTDFLDSADSPRHGSLPRCWKYHSFRINIVGPWQPGILPAIHHSLTLKHAPRIVYQISLHTIRNVEHVAEACLL